MSTYKWDTYLAYAIEYLILTRDAPDTPPGVSEWIHGLSQSLTMEVDMATGLKRFYVEGRLVAESPTR